MKEVETKHSQAGPSSFSKRIAIVGHAQVPLWVNTKLTPPKVSSLRGLENTLLFFFCSSQHYTSWFVASQLFSLV